MGLSLRAYAKHRKALGLRGGTDAAVRKAVATGRIRLLADGTVDPVAADASWDANTVKVGKPDPEPMSSFQDTDDDGPPLQTDALTPKQKVTLNDVKIAREKVKLKKELRLEDEAVRKLVPREPARRFVFNLALSYATSLQALPDVKGPQIAARFGISEHDMVQALKDMVREHLEEISREPTDVAP
jgi:hypothetical protein